MLPKRRTMKFADKLFLGLVMTATLSSLTVSGLVYASIANRVQSEYLERYALASGIAASAFQQMERITEQVNTNAAYVLYEIERTQGIPSDAELRELAKRLGVEGLNVINKHGRFIRSPIVPIEKQTRSLFDYCDDYRLLIEGDAAIETTAIMPSFTSAAARKWTMIPNHDRTLIFESSINLEYIGTMLRDTVRYDPHIRQVGLHAPNGRVLASMTSAGVYHNSSPEIVEPTWFGHRVAGDHMQFSFKVPSNVKTCCECAMKGVAAPEGVDHFYALRMDVSLQPLHDAILLARQRIVALCVMAIALASVVARLLSQRLVNRLLRISNTASDIIRTENLDLRVRDAESNDEVGSLATTFNVMLQALTDSRDRLIESERLASLAKLAGQVAHDIRSPLAALSVVLSDLARPSEETRVIARSAIYRIQDIANLLLAEHRPAPPQDSEAEAGAVVLLQGLVDMVVTENRVRYRTRLGVVIENGLATHAYGVFVRVPSTEFKCVLSNLLNNAVEAIATHGRVTIDIDADASHVLIRIQDDGQGMPADLCKRLGEEPMTHGKSHGNGMGVYHARAMLQAWGGSLRFDSAPGEGTTVHMRLPRVAAPPWFLECIQLTCVRTIVVCDDDVSIHSIWADRIARAGANIALVHASTPEALRQSCALHGVGADTLYLMDYELLGHALTGLDLIEELGLGRHAVLVTSRFEETHVIDGCLARGVRLVPKPAAAHVPLMVDKTVSTTVSTADAAASKPHVDVVLIDNDALVLQAWRLAAHQARKSVALFNAAETFLAQASHYHPDTPIYIDAELDDGVKGEDVAKVVHARGFKTVYLATGHAPEHFSAMPWITQVVDKRPPFDG